MGIIASGAMIGGMGSLACQYVVELNQNSVACIAGALIMVLIYAWNQKRKVGWVREWALTVALLGGMLIATLI